MTKKRVLLTGAAGRVGTALRRSWEADDRYELTLTDVREIEGAQSRTAIGELTDPAFAAEVCAGQEAVVALVYVKADRIGEPDAGMSDIAMNMQLFEIAHRAGVGKIVYASSNHATGWNERLSDPPVFSTADQFNPDGWYGAMKGMAEIAGMNLVNVYGRRFISIRIGTFTGSSEPTGLRLCSTLLAPADAAQLFGLAVDYEGEERFLITYGTSENVWEGHTGFLDISVAREVLGYRPQVNVQSHRGRFAAS